GEHGALLAVDEHGQPPRRDLPVELDALALAEPRPDRAPVDVDELVGEDAAVVGARRVPRDVPGGVPLVALGLLVEPAHAVGLDGVVELEHRLDLAGDHSPLHDALLQDFVKTLSSGVPPRLVKNPVVQILNSSVFTTRGRPASSRLAR